MCSRCSLATIGHDDDREEASDDGSDEARAGRADEFEEDPTR